MSDDKSKTDGRDRSKVAGSEDYEVQHFATVNNLTPEEVRDLISKHGNSRDKLESEAAKIRQA